MTPPIIRFVRGQLQLLLLASDSSRRMRLLTVLARALK
jgi:hypothetical protein